MKPCYLLLTLIAQEVWAVHLDLVELGRFSRDCEHRGLSQPRVALSIIGLIVAATHESGPQEP